MEHLNIFTYSGQEEQFFSPIGIYPQAASTESKYNTREEAVKACYDHNHHTYRYNLSALVEFLGTFVKKVPIGKEMLNCIDVYPVKKTI